MRLSKTISLERVYRHTQLEILAEVFNITNKANFGQNFNDNVNSAAFGKPINIIAPPRTGQLGIRLTF